MVQVLIARVLFKDALRWLDEGGEVYNLLACSTAVSVQPCIDLIKVL